MAREKKSRRGKKSTVSVNFKGVESRQTPPEGDYKLKVLEATSETSGAGNDQITFVLEIAEGKYEGQKVWFYCPLAENSLWKLHAFLTALGEEVPEDEMDIDLGDLVDREVVGVLTHETYQGKKRAKMTDFDSIENYSGGAGEDDDDEDDKKSKGKKSKKDEEPEAPDYDDMDEDDLRDLVIERELATKKEAKKLDDDELKELLEKDDKANAKKSKGKKSSKDEEDEKPSKKSSKKDKGKKAKKYDKSDVEDMDEEELQEIIDKHDLSVDLDDFKKLPKKVAAVIEALEEEDLLDDDD